MINNSSQKLIEIKRKIFDLYYSELNDRQKEAVFTVNGPLLVLAGAGSGKTTVLVKRISHIINFGNAYFSEENQLISEQELNTLESIVNNRELQTKELLKTLLYAFAPKEQVAPWQIMSITFTNKAANEMKSRLYDELGECAADIAMGTFHSICIRILRQHIELLGYKNNFTVYDENDVKKIISSIIKDLKLDENVFAIKTLRKIISNAKNSLIEYEEFEKCANTFTEKMYAEVYKKYQEHLFTSNAVDFDDIILNAIKILKNYPEVKEKYQNKYKYVLVDEYQDTNKAQNIFLSLIVEKNRNIMVVGDDDQSIYKFRGAKIDNILNFDKEFSECKTVFLEQNYRSTQTILNSANALISHNKERKGKVLWTQKERGEKISLRQLPTQEEEAVFIADTIERLVSSKRYNYNDFAVLYRTNAQSNVLETIFSKSGLPHRLLGGIRFFERAEIKDIISYLCVISNENDTTRLLRIINTPKRGIGDVTLSLIAKIADENNISFYETISKAETFPELEKQASKLKKFYNLIEELKSDMKTLSLPALFREVIQKSGYLDMLNAMGQESKDKIDNLDELISSAISHSEKGSGLLEDYLEEIALITDVDDYNSSENTVSLMTIHSAKGLEFNCVFLPGMEENIFPSSLNGENDDEIAEERRLAYVALTRARKKVFILHTSSRLLYGKTSFNNISRFVTEIPPENLDSPIKQRRNSFMFKDEQNYSNSNVFNNKSKELFNNTKSNVQPHLSFKVGDRVKHIIFGDGIITEAKDVGGDVLYVIAFDKVGNKKLMGSYAKLQKNDM